MGLRAWEDGESESHTVMVWIGVEPSARSLHTKVGRLPSGVSSRDRQTIHLDKGRQTMKGLSLWCTLDPIHRAWWQLAIIVKAYPDIIWLRRVLLSRRLRGLSRVLGNSQARFLGGRGSAMRPSYPAGSEILRYQPERISENMMSNV